MSVVIIDYGSGNLRSAEKAFQAMAQGAKVCLSSHAEDVIQAERIVLPGVGAFADCIDGLRSLPGMIEALEQRVIKDGRPFLGICVGMQLLCARGHENGLHGGLGWVAGDVRALSVEGQLKIPHMGWNELNLQRAHPVADGLQGAHMYFVHSFAAQPERDDHIIGTTHHGSDFVAVMGRDNIVGTQFHPEKSQRAGLHLIRNFLAWRP